MYHVYKILGKFNISVLNNLTILDKGVIDSEAELGAKQWSSGPQFSALSLDWEANEISEELDSIFLAIIYIKISLA